MKLKNEKLHAILFFSFAVILSLAVGEMALRFISNRILIYNIEMLKYGKELKMRDPLNEISHVHRANSAAHLMGVDISLNSMGNRSRELTEPKPANEKRVYILGSSVTMGWGVPEDKVFSSLTEQKLNQLGAEKYNFVNAGVGNYGTFSSTKLFYRQFDKVKPDMVIVHYFIADVEPRLTGSDSPILQRSYLGAYLYSDIKGAIFKNNFGDLFSYYKQMYSDDSIPWRNTQGYISELRDFLAAKKIPLLIMIIPDFHNLSPETPYKALYMKMQSAFEGMKIPTINTFPEFQKLYGNKENALWIQTSDPHPNANGHQVMADILVDYFLKQSPLESNR